MTPDFSTPFENLCPKSEISGFVAEKAEPLVEIGGYAYILRHAKTGARLMWLANADDNKAFAIAFKTPPANDTGVFHILEHSVLCGSNKFPVKEPFVNLLKTSMQTFLNALTFSDKTMYPVASTNEQDLENLIDVYLDAVLHPAIYKRPRIFEQEGWHIEAELGDDGAPVQPAKLFYNGVVYNEMKGAMSSPEEVLICGIARALFEGGPYGYVSGGDPESIPTLTYNEFINTHARHYQLSNSYSILYGNLDIEKKLAYLDERFSAAENRGAGEPNKLELCPPRATDLLQVPMATTPDNACVAAAYVFGTSHDRERVLAADILVDALIGSNEAPLKKKVLESGLGRDVSGFLFDGLLQPIIIFELKGAKEGVARQFAELVEATCAELIEAGLGHDNLEASLAQAEFNLRESEWGYPDGVGLAIQAMSGWLYNDDDATAYLHYEDELAHLHAGLENGYFEQLLKSCVCECNHKCCVEVVPTDSVETSKSVAALNERAAAMSADEIAAIAAEAEALHTEQATPDTPEGLATLPQLHLSDIGEGPAAPETTTRTDLAVPCYHHHIETRHIGYAYWYFDLSALTYDDLPYATILANLLGKLDTEKHDAFALDTLCESKLGSLSFFTETYSQDGSLTDAHPHFVVGASALSSNMDWLATLPVEVWSTTKLDDKRRIKDILEQRRIGMEMAFVDSGHAAALARVNAQFSASAQVAEKLGGVEFYLFLRDLLAHFDERYDQLVAKLQSTAELIFNAPTCQLGFTGSAEDLDAFAAAAGDMSLRSVCYDHIELELPKRTLKNEAFIVPSNVCFVAEGMAGSLLGAKHSGTWSVAARALSFDYLWNNVRVLGGAYGCGFRCTADALLEYYSYRDPAVDPTVKRFEEAAAWLSAWQPTDDELEGYIVSCVAGMDAPVKPRALGRRLDAERLAQRSASWRDERRGEMLKTTPEKLNALAKPLAQLPANRGIVIFGGKEIIEASKLAGLHVTELFTQEG